MLNIVNLRRKDDYYARIAPPWVANIWPRVESLNWFLKNNRARLIADGALVKLGRDYFIDVEIFPSAAAKILGQGELTESSSSPV